MLEQLPDDLNRNLVEGVLRAMIEQQRKFIYRLDERLLPYKPHDALFDNLDRFGANRATHATVAAPVESTAALGPQVDDLIARYLSSKRSQWVEKTRTTNASKLQLMVEHLGPAKIASTVTPDNMRAYRDGLLRLRRNHHTGTSGSFAERQTCAKENRISTKTAGLTFDTARAFWNWAVSEGYTAVSPMAGIRIQPEKKAKGADKVSRRPFAVEDLRLLFSAPVFAGCRSRQRRFEAGSKIIRDAKYWIPILAYYTGARLGELVQLHKTDVGTVGALPLISINEECAGNVHKGDQKHVKSEAGVREIPLHPHVMKLGFGEFVEARRSSHPGEPRLFHEVSYGADGQPSTTYSKWFRRLLNSVGLNDPGLVFHSFRHGMEDIFRDASTPQFVTDSLMGHADGKTSSQYGQGVSTQRKMEAILNVNLPLDLSDFLATSDPTLPTM